MARPRAVVVGAGVIGMTSAIRLLEAGFDVRIVARERSPHTTSDVAGAIWYPYLADPPERVLPWSRATREALATLAAYPSGVRQIRLLELFAGPAEEPWWKAALPGFAWARDDELPAGYRAAYDLRVPLIDTSVHMPWLARRVSALGGRIARGTVRSLAEGFGDAAVLVNCAGVDAGTLADDTSVVPIRGQVARLAPVPGVTTALVDESDPGRPVYVIPRDADIIVGGTAQRGARDRTPDPETARTMLARARALEPRLAGARVLSHAVGLRPGRPAVRLELEWIAGRPVVHNYGHGGSGFTLAWGCADDVARLAAEATAAP